jgi:YD repeat-containing protein
LATKEVRFGYDVAGLNTSVERYLSIDNGQLTVDNVLAVRTTNSYDGFGRLTGITQFNGFGQTISNTVDVLDGLDRLSSQTRDGQSRDIAYDKTDQVTRLLTLLGLRGNYFIQ